MSEITLEKLLYTQGFGTRRFCRQLIASGALSIDGKVIDDKDYLWDTKNKYFTVNDQMWMYYDKLYVMLHKPKGYECSHRPSHHDSLLTLLPVQYLNRGIQCVGRLDVDTTGLILLSDDGAFIHQMTSPKKIIEKRYLVSSADALDSKQVQHLLDGVVLRGEKTLTRASTAQILNEKSLLLGITSGKYHQVKRMLGAIGNAVVDLHRQQIGSLVLDASLKVGQWRHLTELEKQFFGY